MLLSSKVFSQSMASDRDLASALAASSALPWCSSNAWASTPWSVLGKYRRSSNIPSGSTSFKSTSASVEITASGSASASSSPEAEEVSSALTLTHIGSTAGSLAFQVD